MPRILSMNPREHHQEIARLAAGVDFPWDTRRAYELALIKTFAAPSSSRLLASTGEFVERTAKRHDDTVAIIAALGLHGYESEEGRTALRIMNKAHAAYAIGQEEYRYTLSLFVLEPIRWNQRFGWRRLSRIEKDAGFHFWCEVGRRMGIRDLPETLEAMEEASVAYEKHNVHFDPANRIVLEATIREVVRRRAPRWLKTEALPIDWLLRVLAPLLGASTAKAFGVNAHAARLPSVLVGMLRLRAWLLRWFPARTTIVGMPNLPTYPSGVKWSEVGPAVVMEERT